ncbi:MAG: hypothetical protein MZU84_05065 [Sphingobacterium sp.]|nr:hypothetical protein [Sphingobacterium sp.]
MDQQGDSGLLDFEHELREMKPDIFFVNEDGYTRDKKKLCDELGIELVVSRRIPQAGLPPRSDHGAAQRVPRALPS